MIKIKKDKVTKVTAAIIVLLIVISGIFVSYEYLLEDAEDEDKESEILEIDDQISPYTNQGLYVKMLRIRHRGLLDKIMTRGTSWKNKPSFYYIATVDGKEGNSIGSLGEQGVYTDWDSFGEESLITYYVKEEKPTSDVTISIMEQTTSGLFKKTSNIEQEKIHVTYDYRTGRWDGKDDSFMDSDGYGHFVGDIFEVWFYIYQEDYDDDGIPYWTEVNVLGTDPAVDDREEDPDKDGIPTSWEWKWNYDPFTWNDHKNLDPDVDGIENDEEYQMRKRLANPYQPDIFIETDGMEKKGPIDVQHIFYKESQQMIIERFCQHGISVFIDDGWPDSPRNGGGETLPFHVYLDDVLAKQLLKFYEHNFPDDRKGIFRYLIAGFQYSGFITALDYNKFDAMHIGNSLYDAILIRDAFTPRTLRITFAAAVLHELGHSFGLMPVSFPGNDIIGPAGYRYPSMPEDEYNKYQEQYISVMNYNFIYDHTLFDYSDGSNGAPYDQKDWDHLFIPAFEVDTISFEEPTDETFEDFEVSIEYPGVILKDWEQDITLTENYAESLSNHAHVKNTDCTILVYKKVDNVKDDENTIRIYARPNVEPVYSIFVLVAEGKLESNNEIRVFSIQDEIQKANELMFNSQG